MLTFLPPMSSQSSLAAFFKPKVKEVKISWHPLTVWPPVATAVLCIALFFFADPIVGLAQAMVTG